MNRNLSDWDDYDIIDMGWRGVHIRPIGSSITMEITQDEVDSMDAFTLDRYEIAQKHGKSEAPNALGEE